MRFGPGFRAPSAKAKRLAKAAEETETEAA